MKQALSFQGESFLTNLLKDVFFEFSEEMVDERQIDRILSPVLEKIKDGKFSFLDEERFVETNLIRHINIYNRAKANNIEIISILFGETEGRDFSIEIAAVEEQDVDLVWLCGHVLDGTVTLGQKVAGGAGLILCDEENTIIVTAKTNVDGTFSVGFIGEGKYTLIVVPAD